MLTEQFKSLHAIETGEEIPVAATTVAATETIESADNTQD